MLRLSEAMKNKVIRKKFFVLVYERSQILTSHSGIPNILKKSIFLTHPR